MSTFRSSFTTLRAVAAVSALTLASVVPAAMAAAGDGNGHRHAAAGTASASQSPVEPTRQKNCVERLRACGFPNAANTGVKNASMLKPSSSVNADRDGEVVENLDITGEINVTAPNVVIRNTRSRVSASSGDWVIIIRPGAQNLTIKDSEIMSPAGAAVDNACMFNISDAEPDDDPAQHPRLQRRVSTRWRAGRLLHPRPRPHARPLHITLVVSQLRRRHHDQAQHDPEPPRPDRSDRLLPGLRAAVEQPGREQPARRRRLHRLRRQRRGRRTHDIRFVDNRFSRIFYNSGGYWGLVASFDLHNPGNEWSGNFWDDTLKLAH